VLVLAESMGTPLRLHTMEGKCGKPHDKQVFVTSKICRFTQHPPPCVHLSSSPYPWWSWCH